MFGTNQPSDRIVKYHTTDNSYSDWPKLAGRSNGSRFDKARNSSPADAKNQLRTISPDKKVTVRASGSGGKLRNGPNDLGIRPDGNLHFTDPLHARPYRKRDKAIQQPGPSVYCFAVKSKKGDTRSDESGRTERNSRDTRRKTALLLRHQRA